MTDDFNNIMIREFEMTEWGFMSYFLRIKVKQDENKTFITQKRYAESISKKFIIKYSKEINTLIACGTKLNKSDIGKKINSIIFKSLIRSLRYLTMGRPDISYGVRLISQYMENPKEYCCSSSDTKFNDPIC